MPLIARTNGALSGEPLEIRDGVLTDIAPADRDNWRLVDENEAPPLADDVSQVRTVPTFAVQPDGSVKRTWEVATYQTAWVKKELKQYASGIRRRVLRQGVFVGNHKVETDHNSLTAINNAIYALEQGTFETIAWRTTAGQFVSLNLQQMKALHAIVATHIQACFDVEKTVYQQIEAGVITTKTQINQANWPSS